MINLWKLAKEVIHYYSAATIKPSAAAGLWQSFFFYLTSWVFLPPAEIHIELGLMNLIDLNEKTVSVLFKIEKRNGDKRSAACTIIKSIYLKIWIYTKCIKWLPYIGQGATTQSFTSSYLMLAFSANSFGLVLIDQSSFLWQLKRWNIMYQFSCLMTVKGDTFLKQTLTTSLFLVHSIYCSWGLDKSCCKPVIEIG